MTSENLTEILIISNYYPPMELGGAKRIVKFIKYLPSFDYQPVILTQKTYGTLSDDVETLTFRAEDLLGHFKRTYRKKKEAAKKATKKTREDYSSATSGPILPSISELLKLLLAPDAEISWYFPAYRLGSSLLSSRPIKIIYSTSPSETNHLVALKLKQKTGLPWVVDFRDGWMFEPLQKQRIKSRFRHYIDTRMERKVIQNADKIVTVNEIIATDFVNRYPEAFGKVCVIPNGYDAEDFADLSASAPKRLGKFQLVHTGKLSLSRIGTEMAFKAFLEALKKIKKGNLPILDDLEIIMVGSLTSEEIKEIENHQLREYFILPGSVTYEEALQYQINADALLLITCPQSLGVSTSKLFEYLVTGRPIFAITNRLSAASKLISDMEAGIVVDPDDLEGIQKGLKLLYQKWKLGGLPTKLNPRVSQFERRHLTSRLSEIFNQFFNKQ